ncbi:MAG TPA: RHS repeat-associated core domain-containing protein, partial [Pyrinomonadaceae bacterium]|nr:RHS repeat-associated core domain-containing protein [Pyrinomonadaceae bacterium]
MGVPVRYNSIDGTFLSAIVNPANDPSGIHWTLFMPDGTQVIKYNDGSERVRDTNGNSIKIFGDNAVGHYQDEQTGREIKIVNTTSDPSHSQVQVQYQTVNGQPEQITINGGETVVKGKLYRVQDWNRNVYTETGGQGDTCWRQQALQPQTLSVIREIVFPQTEPNTEARRFTFAYDSDQTETVTTEGVIWTCGSTGSTYTREASRGLGALSQMVTPSGATVDYSYSLASRHDFLFIPDGANEMVREAITQKTLTHDGVTDTWTYDIENNGVSPISTVTNPDGSSETMMFYPFNPDFSRGYGVGGEQRSGLVFRTQESGLTRVEKHWTMQGTAPATGSENIIAFNPYMDAEYTSLLDVNGNPVKMSAKKYQYDFNGNLTEVKEYDWFDPSLVTRDSNGVPTDVPAGATLLRDTTTSYYNTAPDMNSPNYYANRSLTSGVVSLLGEHKEADLGASKTQFSYDGQAYDTAPTKGNPTSVSKWDDVTNSWLTTSMSYDSYGNVISTTDPKGNVTQVFYEDATHAMPTRVVVDPNNGTGQQTTLTSYDFSTGLVTSQTDANLAVSTIDYNNQLLGTIDPFGRPGAAYSPAVNGTSPRHKTVTTYEDHLRRVTVASDLNAEGDGLIKSRTTSDQLGRAILAEQSEDGTNFTISSQTVYEQMGRITYTSNPSRGDGASTDGWTRATKDLLGRVTEIATFSGSTKPTATQTDNSTGTVTTSYDANYTTVTDQAGKQRRSVTNATGQLVRVDEPDASNNLGSTTSPTQPTNYSYDVLGNLTQVTQGLQTRTFTYSSLSRLTSAKNPEVCDEHGTPIPVTYQYDANGNLTQKTDARGVITTYIYDRLNRVTTRSYSDGTPAVTYQYDTAGISNSKGRLTSVISSVSTTSYGQYDALGRVRQSSQTTGGQTYTLSYGYNLAGAMISETYPSGRVVTTGYDNAGRINSISGQKAGESDKTYASQFSYTAHGAVKELKLGNNLWEHTIFNSRLQPQLIGLGTSQLTPTAQDYNRFRVDYYYGTTDNNGNVQQQTISVPDVNGNYIAQVTQYYSYDELNRLKSATEMSGSNQSWKQTYHYDRWGNRTFDAANTTLPSPLQNPSINSANNNQIDAGQGYVYDSAGNLKNMPGLAMTYDAENHQVSANDGQSYGLSTYAYDGDGHRVKKVTGSGTTTTIFVYDAGGKMVAEYSTASQQGSGGTSYLTEDSLGTPRIITGASGEVKARHDYLPFGEELQAGIGGRTAQQGYVVDNVNQKFTQKERDSETGLDYFIARYYSASQGRFTSVDPLGGRILNPQTLNKYLYVRNNPLRLTDPTGMYICADSKKCDSDDDKKFEKARQHDLKSKDPDVVRAARAYGDPNKDNGVTVQYGDPGDGKDGITRHDLEIDPNDPNKTKFRAKETVTIRSGLSGASLDAVVGHEGSHVADAEEFVGTINEKTGWFDITKNLSTYDTEVRAYKVSHSILASENEHRDFGQCGLDPCRLGAGVIPARVNDIIDNLLANPANRYGTPPNYGVSPNNPGPLLYPDLTTPARP